MCWFLYPIKHRRQVCYVLCSRWVHLYYYCHKCLSDSRFLRSSLQTVGLQVLSDHLWGLSYDASHHSFISFVVMAGLTVVVITLGCFLQLRLIKHIALWLSFEVGKHFTVITAANGLCGEEDAVCCICSSAAWHYQWHLVGGYWNGH